MLELLEQFENKQPEIVFEWKDSETEAEGWVVINSLRGGAAGGGTRMRSGLNKAEVISLAKTMEIKFTVAGPPMGGAKSGINFDPSRPEKKEVLQRWYKAVLPLLKSYYGTGGDMNVDEVKDVIPITSKLGLLHPQEGVLQGFYNPDIDEKKQKISQLKTGVSLKVKSPELTPDPKANYVVADLITGFGVSESVRHYYSIFGNDVIGKSLEGKRVIIQGWGNVASAAAWYMAKEGANIVGVIDRDGGLIRNEGFTLNEITELFCNKIDNCIHAPVLKSFEEVNQHIWDVPADIFLPCAASRLVTLDQLERLKDGGIEVISSGANVPFNEQRIFYGDVTQYADENFSLIPDFIANCGMARTFAYLLETGIEIEEKTIFNDVSECIRRSLEKIHRKNNKHKLISKTAFEIALKNLV
jgi:glutamate dehydrogenase/leucine dehydrogenase